MSDFQRPQFPPKNKPCKDEEFYTAWGLAHWYCAACGRTEGLSTHHIVKQGRAHEACNLLRLCLHPCHDLAEGLDVRVKCDRCKGKGGWETGPHSEACHWCDGHGSALLPKLTLGICLSLKLRADPGELSTGVDWQRLEQLRGSRLPDLEPIPQMFIDLFRRNRPEFGGR